MNSNSNNYIPAKTSIMLLAAGEGKRMLPLTKNLPKPLLKVDDASLIEHHLIRLRKLGFKHVVINIAHLANLIQEQLGNGSKYGLNIKYSDESDSGALETAGGIIKALPIIKSDPFIVVNADIWTDFDYRALLKPLNKKARLILVDNPPHNPDGDFVLNHNLVNKKTNGALKSLTFSGIALYKKDVFAGLSPEKKPLRPILNSLITQKDVEGQLYKGKWSDIGTPERLYSINTELSQN